MILRGIVIADKVYGGKFITKEDKQVFEYLDHGRTFDHDVKDLLTDACIKHLPYDVEIAPHRLQPGPLMFKNEEFEQMKLSNPQDPPMSKFHGSHSNEKQGYILENAKSKGENSKIIIPTKGKNSLLNRSKDQAKINDKRMLANGEKSFGLEGHKDTNNDIEKSWPAYPTPDQKQKKMAQHPKMGSKDKLPPMEQPIQKLLSNEFVFSPRSVFDEKQAADQNGQANTKTPLSKQDDMNEEEIKKMLIAEEQSIIDEHVQNKKRHFENQSVYFAGDEGKSGKFS